ncbi:MAG: SDR family oxidoreductase [Halothiobacillus sp.]|jgi:nucleoside-diphosphate-sugar epimerase|nr:SDR family oxidoreductase [Halothiobacillus sp.]
MNVLVTGATGFVGSGLVSHLLANGVNVVAGVRKPSANFPEAVRQVVVGDLTLINADESRLPDRDAPRNDNTALLEALCGIDTVIHSAARAHIMNDDASNPLDEFRKVNRDATLVLARKAAASGVKRFVFLSSIKVNGEMTRHGHSFSDNDKHIPTDPYSLSKYEAEQGLLQIASETGLEVVIIRLPLVYGPGVKANFASMMNWMRKGVPLPFGAIHNKRSLVALDNLVDFIALCAERKKSPKAANQVFLISDNEDVSTTQLLRKVAKAQHKQAWLIPVPVGLMTFAAKLIGKEDVANRLFGSLQVDSSKAHDLLGWKPVVTMDEQLEKIAKEDNS